MPRSFQIRDAQELFPQPRRDARALRHCEDELKRWREAWKSVSDRVFEMSFALQQCPENVSAEELTELVAESRAVRSALQMLEEVLARAARDEE